MNRERAKELLPIIEHFTNGGEVQARDGDGPWVHCNDPSWLECVQYRIKPELLECWVNTYPDCGYNEIVGHSSPEEAVKRAAHDAIRIAVHVREVV